MALSVDFQRAVVLAIPCSLLFAPAIAHAEDVPASANTAAISLDRPHTVSEVGLGALTLPRTNLCIPTSNECVTSELTFLVSLRSFFKWNRRWGIGAGVAWGFRPISDDASIHPPDGPAIGRSHTRNYFMLSGGPRYYPIFDDGFDLWVGASGGVIVASDRYSVDAAGTSIVGPKATTINTEGGMVGLGIGADYDIGRNFTFGAWTTEMVWFFPAPPPKVAPTGDPATVSGQLFSFEIGLSIGYRVRL